MIFRSVTGLSTAVVWVGLPLLAFAVLLARGAARAERARVYALPGRVRPVAVSAAARGDAAAAVEGKAA